MEKIRVCSKEERGPFPCLLGATARGDRTCFTIMAAREEPAALLLYERGADKPLARLDFPTEGWGNLRQLCVEGIDRKKTEYCLEIGGRETADPYSRLVYGRPEFGKGLSQSEMHPYGGGQRPKAESWRERSQSQKRGPQSTEKAPYRVYPLPEEAPSPLRSGFLADDYDWESDRPPRHPWNKSVLYQLHVRGFTMEDSAGVNAPGTFGGLTEKIPYLKELGITAVELLPICDFDENGMAGPVNYWGYTGGYLFAPKSAYCDPYCEKPADVQCKDMIKAFHRAGIEVLLQVYFPEETSPELVSQVLRFWTLEYHVDGFGVMGRFLGRMIQQDPVLSGQKLLHYGWDGEDCPTSPAQVDTGFTESMRRLLRGDEEQVSALAHYIRHNPAKWPPIHYIAETNGFTLKDLVSYETKHNELNGENNRDGSWYNFSDNCGQEGPVNDEKIHALRLKQRMNALLLVFLSQGVPLLQAGDEMGHSKGGNNNSWCQDNRISWLSWEPAEKEDKAFWEFTKELIAFRRAHPVFHQPSEPQCCDYMATGMPDLSIHGVHPWLPQYENFRRQLGVLYNGAYGIRESGEKDASFYVMFNFHNAAHTFDLPKAPGGGQWCVRLDTARRGFLPEGKEEAVDGKALELAPRSIVILIEKDREKPNGKKRKKTRA